MHFVLVEIDVQTNTDREPMYVGLTNTWNASNGSVWSYLNYKLHRSKCFPTIIYHGHLGHIKKIE